MKKIVIISGASGSLGEGYLKHFSNELNFTSIGLARTETKNKINNVEYIYCDLLDEINVKNKINKINFEQYSEIIFIHPVGKFKFEYKNNLNEIDTQIYNSNVMTFINISNILSPLAERKKITFCCFGSVSDKYDVPYWRSYTQSKKELKRRIQEASENNNNIRGVFINVSTVTTGNENKLRPFANKKYWLKPEKIVKMSLSEIISGKSQFIELDIFEPCPHFQDTYYLDHEAIYSKWEKEMGRQE
ncbi:hypothetical protein COB57_02650 [Candidatus Peregrinibacteria bacterium]|nr:MAG: hypothetical protein COB57_02650 [Candidatus Peregrinibacteria bacterium]